MQKAKKFAQFVGLGIASLGLFACGGGGGTSSGGTGLMSLAVTDAPIDDAKRVVIRFTHVELKPRDGDRVVICLDGEEPYFGEPSEGRASCETTGFREIDLLALQGEDSEFLFEEVEVPAGEYSWIRFYLEREEGASGPLSNFATSSYIAFDIGPDGECQYCENLIIPGGLRAGLQLVSGFTVRVGEAASFTVDFDLRHAIQKDDEFEGYHRMRRALRLVDNSNVGVILGTVDHNLFPRDYTCDGTTDDVNILTCPGLSVSVYEGGTQEVQPAAAEERLAGADVRYRSVNGTWEHRYTVGFLSEGLYDLELILNEDVLNEVDGVTVGAGQKTVVNFPIPTTD